MPVDEEMKWGEGEPSRPSGAPRLSQAKAKDAGSWIPLREAVGRVIAVAGSQPWSALHDAPPQGAIPCSAWREIAACGGKGGGHSAAVQGDSVR